MATADAAVSPQNHVLIGTISLAKSQEIVSTLRAKHPGTTFSAIEIDTTSPPSVAAAVQTVDSLVGKLDELYINSGINDQNPDRHIHKRDITIANVVEPALVTQKFLELLKKGNTPKLFFINSPRGVVRARSDPTGPTGQLFPPKFKHSKKAIDTLMQIFLEELKGHNISIIGLCPGVLAWVESTRSLDHGIPHTDASGRSVRTVVETDFLWVWDGGEGTTIPCYWRERSIE